MAKALRTEGGPVGGILVVAAYRFWQKEEPNVATAERFAALAWRRLAGWVREIERIQDVRRRYAAAHALVAETFAEAREDAAAELEGLRVQIERIEWELEATEAAVVRVYGAIGWCEAVDGGGKILTILERVAVAVACEKDVRRKEACSEPPRAFSERSSVPSEAPWLPFESRPKTPVDLRALSPEGWRRLREALKKPPALPE